MYRNMCSPSIVSICILLIFSMCNRLHKSEIELSLNHQQGHIFVQADNPAFSWYVPNPVEGMAQESYELILADNLEDIQTLNANVWTSGKINSSQSHLVAYNGPALENNKKYYWNVKIGLKDGRELIGKEPSSFTTALPSTAWQANWIGMDLPKAQAVNYVRGQKSSGENRQRSIFVRKDVKLSDKVRSARAYVSGLGAYVFYVNGQRIGKDYLTPGWTHYPYKVQYQGYEITDYVKEGINCFAAILGNSWWSSGLGWNGGEVYSDEPLRFTGIIIIEYISGKTDTVITDQNWQARPSPIIENTLYHGEIYDANLEVENWNMPETETKDWYECVVFDNMKDIKMAIQPMPTMQITETLEPKSIFEPVKGVYVVDFGQNMTGWAKIKINEPHKSQITLKYAELLHTDSTVAQENLRSARASDSYISSGDGQMVEWSPLFTYHGYRYVQVEGLSKPLKPEDILAEVMHTNIPVTGHFESSNEVLTRFFKNTVWGLRSNMMSVPTDCPQRDERLGWMGDAQIIAPTANYMMNMAPMWRKWTYDIIDCQDSTGYTYDVNPAIVVGGPGKPGWADAITVVPWMTYLYFGDTAILKESYEACKKWVNYMESQSKNYIYEFGKDEWGGYGDWVAVEPSPTKPIGGIYFRYSSLLLSKMAKILGKDADHAYYKSLADSISIAYQDKYFLRDELNYVGETQTANLLPLVVGIVPELLKNQIASNIVNNVIEKGNHHTTGFLGTAFICPVLSDYGHHELAYKVATHKEYPSWGYMLENGATTIWELWNSDKEKPEGMNSRNHFAYGSVVEWYFSHLAGIKPVETNPGFSKSIIKPMPVGDLSWVKSEITTAYGTLKSAWKKTDGELIMNILIPFNTESSVYLPDYKVEGKVIINQKELQDKQLIKQDAQGMYYLELLSGEYEVRIISKN